MYHPCFIGISVFIFLLPVAASCQEPIANGFPYGVQRDWRILPHKIVRGTIVPDAKPYVDGHGYHRPITILDYSASFEEGAQLFEIHPEDAAFFEFASTWAELKRSPERLPSPDDVDFSAGIGSRAVFPYIQMQLNGGKAPGLSYFFASYAAWWNATGFLPAPQGNDALEVFTWAMDIAKSTDGLVERRLNDYDAMLAATSKLIKNGYGNEIRFSAVSVPFVDSDILHHYSNSNDMLLLRLTLSKDGVLTGSGMDLPPIAAVVQADKSGIVDFLFEGKMARGKLVPVEDPTKISGLVVGARELVIPDRTKIGEPLTDSNIRVFINPAVDEPLWVFRPFKMKSHHTTPEMGYLIPPPKIEGFDESLFPGLISLPVATAPPLNQISLFGFEEKHIPAKFSFEQIRNYEPREWKNTEGKAITATYAGKEAGFFLKQSVIIRDGKEMEIGAEQLSPFDKTYLTMMNADSGVGPTEENGRILYRLIKPGEEIPLWLEVNFSRKGVTATIQRGSAFFAADNTIPDSREALIDKGSDLFQINWTSMKFRNLTRNPTKEPTGAIEVADIIKVRSEGDEESELDVMVSNGAPVEHLGLPVRELELPEAFSEEGSSGEFHIEYSSLRYPWLTGFWRVFSEKSDSSFAKEVNPVKGVFQSFHRLGFVPVELRYEHPTSPELSFHLKMEEIQFSSESPATIQMK